MQYVPNLNQTRPLNAVYEIECKKCKDICLSTVNFVRTFITFDLSRLICHYFSGKNYRHWSIEQLEHMLQHKRLVLGRFLFSASSLRARVSQTFHDQPRSTRDPLVVEVFSTNNTFLILRTHSTLDYFSSSVDRRLAVKPYVMVWYSASSIC